MDWKRGEAASESQSLLLKTPPRVKFLLELGGWVLLGWTGLVLSGIPRNPTRLVYGSAALVASLRGQQSHFATLPISWAGALLRGLSYPPCA